MRKTPDEKPLGFPLFKLEREALDQLVDGAERKPRGVGNAVLLNFLTRGWVLPGAALETYVITGKAIEIGLSRPAINAKSAHAGAYAELNATLEELDAIAAAK